MSEKEYHIKLSKEDVGKYILMPGDPQRVEKMARYLDDSKYIGSNREFTSYGGYLEGEKVSIVSSGIGGPSTAIAVEELKNLGVHTIIRVGTCGSIQPHIKDGSIIIPSGVVRGGRTGEEYLPNEFPAVPHHDILYSLKKAVKKLDQPAYVGITHCKDAFFKENSEKTLFPEYTRSYWAMLRKANVLSSEMESDTLFLISSIRKIRAGAVFAVIGAIHAEKPITSPGKGVDSAIEVAVEALRYVIQKDREMEECPSEKWF